MVTHQARGEELREQRVLAGIFGFGGYDDEFHGTHDSTALGGLNDEDVIGRRQPARGPRRARGDFVIDGDGHAFAVGESEVSHEIGQREVVGDLARLFVDKDGHGFE